MNRVCSAIPTLALLSLALAGCSQPEAPAAAASAKTPPAASDAKAGEATPPGEAPKGDDVAKPADAAPADASATGAEPPADGTPPAEKAPSDAAEPDAAKPDAKAEPDAKAGDDTKPASDAKKPASTDDGASATPAVDGKELYLGKCKSCHGADGKGDTSMGKKIREAGGEFPSLAGTKLSKAKIVEILENGIPDTKMKSYKDKLTTDEMGAVATYVKKL